MITSIRTFTQQRRLLLRALRGLGLIAAGAVALLLLVCGLIVAQAGRDEAHQANVAVVLGAAQWNGSPSPVLRARLDRALDLYQRRTVSAIILTGGVGKGDTTSEAAAGREYLLSRGVEPGALFAEETGTTTLESLTNAAQIIREQGMPSVLLVSDGYHMLRSLKIAHDLGLDAAPAPIQSASSGLSAEEAGHVLREAGAYLMYIFARQ
ncbi:YdcF family protein [Chloroflexia bacterium SDU3-3]|nr:YdcF family protein [Chloroflexia bacterium SDU3-3]